jgi:4'-phosphopantetheinyl transferase
VTTADIPELTPGSVQVWWAQVADADRAPMTLLSVAERSRRDTYRQQIDQDRFAIGALLVRLLLAVHTATDAATLPVDRTCEICARPHGRPTLPGSDLRVSVSHAGDRIAVACGRVAALGVDVEPAAPPADAAAMLRAVLSPDEHTEPERFMSYWTRKESVLKATGDGLRVPMTDVTVTAADLPPALLAFRGRPDLPDRTTMATLSPGGDYIASLAVIDVPDLGVSEHTASNLMARFVTEMDAR